MFQLSQIIEMDFGLQQTPKTPRQRFEQNSTQYLPDDSSDNNKQSNAHSYVVRIDHKRGRCNRQNVSELSLKNRKHQRGESQRCCRDTDWRSNRISNTFGTLL